MSSEPTDPAALAVRIAELEATVSALSARVRELEDVEAIKRLQRAYGYYIDKALWTDVIDLFADDCEIEISGRGVYLGRAGADIVFRKLIGQLIGHAGGEGLAHGQLHNHFQLQGIVHVAPDGRTAKGRWRSFIQVAQLGELADWAEGPYEMDYVRQDGVWRIRRMVWFATYYTAFDQGWAKGGRPLPRPSSEFPPDRPPSHDYESFPATFAPPFHYPHPVRGR